MGARRNPVRLQHKWSRAIAKDPTDTQELRTKKHCSLQLASLCKKIWGEEIVLQYSGIQTTELVVFRYFLMGEDLQGTSSWCLFLSYCTTFCFAPMCAFSVLASSVCDPFPSIQMENHIGKNAKPLSNQLRIQNQNPVNALIWKNRITLPGNKRGQNALLFFCTCIALTKRNGRS